MNNRHRKAVRLVLNGAVQKLRIDGDNLSAEIAGDHGIYKVAVNPDQRSCTCLAGQNSHLDCSHVYALQLAAEAKREGVI
jgi:uncharacterized Zn finger protein